MKTFRKNIFFIFSFLILFNGNIFSQITGPGGPFDTFSDVVSYLNGLSSFTSDIVYEVSPGTYNEQITLPYLALNDNYKIIFRKKADETGEATVSFAPSSEFGNYVIRIEGAHYQFENINFQNTSVESEMKGRVLTFYNAGNLNDDNWFKNCKFSGINVANTDNLSNPDFAVVGYNESYSLSNTHFEFDTITGGSFGVYMEPSVLSYDLGITDCVIKDFTSSGIYLSNMGNFYITSNEIESANGDGTIPLTGIDISNPESVFYVTANKVNLTVSAEKTCIRVSDISTTGTYQIDNNMLTTSNAGPAYLSYGIIFENVSNEINVLYNSIHIQDGLSGSSAFDIKNNNTSVTSFNNLFINTGDGNAMALTDKSQLISSGNNVYFALSEANTIVENGTSYTLESWQISVDPQNPFEASSFYAQPHFVAPDDLHIYSQEYTVVEGRADANWTSITGPDFDGEVRDPSFPDIGADEGMFSLLWVGDIMDNTIWHGTFFVKDTVTVQFSMAKSGNLTILPNTKIKFLDKAKLIVNGTVNAIGYEDSLIVFTAADTLQPWAGISHFTSESSDYKYCKFEYSEAENGGVFNIISNSSVFINNSLFLKNKATQYGGAVYTEDCSPTINADLFYKNSASEGGAVYNTGSEAILSNNIFYENSAIGDGGALAIYNTSVGPVYFKNNTFYNNYAGGSSGHDVYLNNTSVLIYNSIFWSDESNIRVYEMNGNGNSINNCIIKGNVSGTNIASPVIIDCSDPLFSNPAEFNFTVQPNSDAVNAGTNLTGQESEFDFYENPRIFDYQYSGIIDVGAYELQAPKLEADAGEDLSDCGTVFYPYMYDPYPYFGTLTTNNPDIEIKNSESMIYVTNVPPGTTEFYWTVTNGIVSDRDTLLITNLQPYVNAGDDIYLINENIDNNLYKDTVFNANQPQGGQIGVWTQLSGNTVTFSNVSAYNTGISGIEYGQHLFKWTIDDAGCQNSDSLFVIAGHSFVSDPDDGILDWDNAADWDVNGIPGPADSVTVFGCTANINTGDAQCDRIIIGDGGDLFVEGTAKAPASFSCRTIFIEQNAEKFKGVKGTANIHIGSDATVNIGSGYLSKSLSTGGSGLFIGGGGTVFIEQNAEKGSKGTAGLNIGSGGVIFIEQNAEKGVGNAEFHIGDGGYVFMEQNAEKKTSYKSSKSNADFYIGGGGYVFMEQNAEKGTGGYMHLSGGRTIFIEQNAEKSESGGGHFAIYGGTVFIEQNAEKSTKNAQNPSVFCGRGGTIFIEQNAEKALSVPHVILPDLAIDGGTVKIGNSTKSKAATGILEFRQIFIEQNAEKSIADTALIVYPSGGLYLTDETYNGMPSFDIGSGNAVTFTEGSDIQMTNSYFEEPSFSIDEHASFIDYNQLNKYNYAINSHIFNGGKDEYYTPVIQNVDRYIFGNGIGVSDWSESSFDWNILPDAASLTSGKGYFFQPDIVDTLVMFWGELSQGDIPIPVTTGTSGTFDMQGWNLLGNPYPSYINLEEISIPYEIGNNFYFVNVQGGSTPVYQQGGVSINGATQFAAPSEVFAVKADADADFVFNNSARVHVPVSTSGKSASDILKLKAENSAYSDEIALLFKSDATDNFDTEYDAVKLNIGNSDSPIFYSTLSDDTPLAINTFADFSGSKTIPVVFAAPENGSYSITASELNFTDNVSVTLKDLKNNNTQDLAANPVYNFTYENGDSPERFEIIFGKASSIDNPKVNQNVTVFTDGAIIFVKSEYDKSDIEIYNINGQLLLQKNISKGLNSFNMNVPTGIYFVKVISKEENISKKIFLSK